MILTALSLAIGLGAVLLPQVPAEPAGPEGPCQAGQGVTVVVQSSQATRVRCASGGYDSALEATQAAGFALEFVPGVAGMVCMIDQLPASCNGAPVDAYWSFWQVESGQWVYATVGAGMAEAAVDSTVGWAFGSGTAPSVAPPALADAPGSGGAPSGNAASDQASPNQAGSDQPSAGRASLGQASGAGHTVQSGQSSGRSSASLLATVAAVLLVAALGVAAGVMLKAKKRQ